MEADKQFFYTNAMEISISPYDLNFKFLRQVAGEAELPLMEQQPKKIAELVVSMSPTHAKAMLTSIYISVMNYEKDVGKIALPEEMQKLFDETFTSSSKK